MGYISQMEAAFIDQAERYIGTCDFSFAIPKHFPLCANESSVWVDDDRYVGYDEYSSTSSASCRSVTFKENVETHTVERYIDQENRGDLFYSSSDLARFREELKMERMHSPKSYWQGNGVVGLRKVLAVKKPLTNMQSSMPSNGDSSETLNRHTFQINLDGMIV